MTTRFDEIMSRRGEIMRRALGMDYAQFERSPIAFDYEAMMSDHGYSLDDIKAIQAAAGVGDTPLLELRNMTDLVRSISAPGMGARIFVKDEAANLAGAFKDRRASISIHVAREKGYAGVIAATSGNYGAAVSSQAARYGLKCIICQETFDSRHIGQPEIVEKSRICESYGAEVIQMTVGPELFFHMVELLDQTGYFAASLYSSFGVSGIETLGLEISREMRARTGSDPTAVVITHAGGGNTTGTARGLKRAGATGTQIVSASVDLSGLHMASDRDFNRKSFTTGHTGFGVPFATWPDRADVPRNAARPLRYIDRYLTVTQGETFFVTEALVKLEGLERGPAGNTAMTAAVSLARALPRDATVVVQETEYTGAGKHHWAQLNFAKEMGVEVRSGDPTENVPGEVIVIPERLEQIQAKDFDVDRMRKSYVRNAVQNARTAAGADYAPTAADIEFLAADTNSSPAKVEALLAELRDA
jgi:cystathionine beta-synthase